MIESHAGSLMNFLVKKYKVSIVDKVIKSKYLQSFIQFIVKDLIT